MKKFLYFVFPLFLFFPFIVNADLQYGNGVYVSNYTTISVNDIGNNGYTIPLQQTTTIYDVNSAFIGFGLNMSYSLVKDRYYELEIGFGTNFSHFNDLANNVTIYSQNNVCVMDSFTDSTTSFPKFRFHCNDDVTGFSLYINNSSNPNALITTAAQFYYNYAFLRYAKSIQEEVNDSLDETNQKLDDINDTISDSTQQIIDNQNQNTDREIESQQVCSNTIIDNKDIIFENKYLDSYGYLSNSVVGNGVTDYIELFFNTRIIFKSTSSLENLCFYDENKTFIICAKETGSVSIPNNAKYVRFTISKPDNRPQVELYTCKNGNQALEDTLTDSNVDSSTGTGFFDNFTNNDFGLSGIITLPLTTIQSLTSSSCVSLSVPIPFTNSSIQLPCMTEIYNRYMPTVFTLWQTVTFGILSYYIALDIFKLVKGFKNPDDDKVEVLDL